MAEWHSRSLVRVEVHPCGRKNRVLREEDGVLHVEVKAPAEQGKANDAVERLLSRASGRDARITRGFTRSRKSVRLGRRAIRTGGP